MTMWMVRAGSGGLLFDSFMENNLVAIGWNELGDLERFEDRAQLTDKLQEVWPDYHPQKATMAAGCLYRLRTEIAENHYVLTYAPARRKYAIGRVTGPYKFDQSLAERYEDYFFHTRPVEWLGEINRDDLTTSSKNSLGAISTLFLVPSEVEKNVLNVHQGIVPDEPEKIDSEFEDQALLEDIEARSFEFTKDQIVRLEWDKMQELVAGLLRAMGYKTKVSPAGPDRGKDIIASPDGFGFEDPRIVVEVKHRTDQIGADAIRSFVGGRHPNDKGLYVSTGGFSKDARYEADRANIPVTLMGIDDLVESVIEYYERLDMDTQRMLPLKRFYWPIG